MPPRLSRNPIDIYVRVSATAGRTGDSFQSPDAQAARCRSQLEADGLPIGSVFTDLDQSGGTMIRPAFNQVMERIRTGESGGVIAADLSRLGRSTQGVLDAVQEITDAGAQVISCSERLDTSSAMGRFVLTVLVALREMELDRYREQFDAATENYLARGGHGGSYLPPGYDRDMTPGRTGSLIPNADAPMIVQAFRMRGERRPLSEIATALSEAGVELRRPVKPESKRKRPATPHTEWTETAVRQMLANTVYLGVASARSRTREGAHEALVTRAEFDTAQAKRVPGRMQNGARTEGALLAGLLRCGTCGQVLTHDGTRYRCNKRGHGVEPCTKRVVIQRDVIEPYVEAEALDFLGHVEYGKKTRSGGDLPQRLERAVADCEAELRAYVELTPAATLGYADGLARREAALRTARSALGASGRFDEEWVTLSAVETVETYRRMSLPDKRKVIAACLRSGVVTPGTGSVEDRVAIEFAPHPMRKTMRPTWIDAPLEYVEA